MCITLFLYKKVKQALMYRKIYLRIIGVVLGIVMSIYYTFFKPNILINRAEQKIIISDQSSFEEITEWMQKNHIIQNVFTFRLASWCLRYHQQIKSGNYELSTSSNNYQTIQKLKKGLQKPVQIMIGNFIQNKDCPNKKQSLATLLLNCRL